MLVAAMFRTLPATERAMLALLPLAMLALACLLSVALAPEVIPGVASSVDVLRCADGFRVAPGDGVDVLSCTLVAP